MAKFWKHRKRGHIYRDLGRVTLQASDLAKLADHGEMVLYVGENGDRHVRSSEEFHDGRFEHVLTFDDARRKDKAAS